MPNPVSEPGDLFRRQRFSFGGHALIRIRGSDAQQQRTFRHLICQHDRTVLAAAPDGRASVETQFGLLFERAVTGVAMRLEQRLDLPQVIHRLRDQGADVRAKNDG